MSTRAMNFNAGPAALPLAALERARDELVDFAGSGMSVMEHSHRGKEYDAVHEEALRLLRDLLAIPATHDVMFLQGGATQQFAQLPMSFLTRGASADYVINGVWGEKAFEEASVVADLYGAKVRVAGTSGTGEGKSKGYVRTVRQDELDLDPSAAYVHFTSNETIHGVEYATGPLEAFPDLGRAPVVCDMSSDILWRPIDVTRFSFIYAGAQKNIGPSGVVIGIAEKGFVARGRKDIPKIFQYRTVIEQNSLLNTPPTFAIYLVRNVLAWLAEHGGLAGAEARNREKARLLYETIDGNAAFYRCPIDAGSRSVMNVVFRLPTESLEERFVREATALRMVGLKGHRSVGGLRVSLYNAVDIAWVRALTDFMREFARANG